ncbi:MAG: hypothetical protein M3Y22_13860, partial [Pseudomonadota bacterium]|nr:hypothetical protein [Pseudomonadota bacterium]
MTAAVPSDIVVTAITGNHGDDEVTIITGSSEISGWQDVDVTLRLEGFPNSFSIAASVTPEVVAAASAGQPCRVLLGNDLVISGFIDRDVITGTASSHNLELLGRGKTQDLVDCSAEWPSGQIIEGDALTIAQSICQPYALSVELGEGADAGPTLPG